MKRLTNDDMKPLGAKTAASVRLAGLVHADKEWERQRARDPLMLVFWAVLGLVLAIALLRGQGWI